MKAIFTSVLYLFQIHYSLYSITKKTVSFPIVSNCIKTNEKIWKQIFNVKIRKI